MDTLLDMALRLPTAVVRLIPALGVVLLTYATPVAADEHRLFALVNGVVDRNSVAHLLEATIVDGRVVSVVTRATVPGRAADGPFERTPITVTAGGRFVVWRQYEAVGSAEGAVVFDRQTGQAVVVGALPLGAGVSDPTRPRLLVPHQNQIASISAEGLAILSNTTGLVPRAISRDGRNLYAIRAEFPTAGLNVAEFVVLDSTTGQILRTVPLPGTFEQVPELVVSADESKVWLTTGGRGSGLTIRAFDMATRSQVLSIPLPGNDARGLLVDEGGQRVAISVVYIDSIHGHANSGEIFIFDAQNGVEVGRTPVEGYSSLHFDPGTRTILAVSHREIALPSRFCGEAVVRVLFPQTGVPPAISRSGSSTCFTAVFASPPAPPRLNTPVISTDRSVSLSWISPPELTNGFVLEAGSAPGLADLASMTIVGTTTITVPNVPPGSYYVRVRARNHIGSSVASNEVRVAVP